MNKNKSGGFKVSKKSRNRSYPPLTKDQQKLVEDHLWIAGKLTHSAHTSTRGFTGCFTREDIESIARFALCVAATRFNPDLGWRFSTFAWNTARGYIQHALRDHSRMVRIPRWIMSVRDEVRSLVSQGTTYDEISEKLNLSHEQIFLCEQSWKEIHKSYDHSPDDSRPSEFVYEIDLFKEMAGKELLYKLGELSDSDIQLLLEYLNNDLQKPTEINKAQNLLGDLRARVKTVLQA